MLLQITYQDKSTQTDENQESKDIFAILTTLSLQMDSMGKRLQQLESQQHDYKNAELSRSEDLKILELEGDVGKLQKTHDKVCLPTAAGTSKQVNKNLHTNVNLNNVFDKPFTSKKPKEAIVITPQTTTYANSLHHNKKVYNHITQTYIENIYKIQTFLNLNPRSTTTTDPTQDYVTQKLQGYNRLIAQPKTKANLVKTCYNYGLLSTVYTHDGEEIIGIPELYKAFVTFKRITKGNLFFIKFYTAPAEILYDEIKSIIHVIKIGLTRDMIIPEEIEQQPEIQKMEIPSFYANKRIIGIATIIQELANNYLQGNAIWSYYSRDQLMIYANSKELRQRDMDEEETIPDRETKLKMIERASKELVDSINKLKPSLTLKPISTTTPEVSRLMNDPRHPNKKNYYKRTSFPDVQFEQDIYLSHYSHDGTGISEWNIDGLAESQIYKKLHKIGISVTAYKMKNASDKHAATLIVSGFTGTLKNWCDNYLSEENRNQILNAKAVIIVVKTENNTQIA
ncbi:uncharacterized protein LOC107788459 [Nicotiana tabacum]|uniref:Uncharacterized protein LOC107788459 n=1 Tax=Nicotiana tabacum TaxID=4097 RepID=A0AC58T4X0_TOBAC